MNIDQDLMLFLGSAHVGDGEPDLGDKLMDSFLKVLLDSGRIPDRIVCMNSGIFLTTDGSPVIESLRKFEELGSEILSCSTCLAYFKREDKLLIGKPTNMKDTVRAMLNYKKVLSP
jgi:selenium metabolism protein YedF